MPYKHKVGGSNPSPTTTNACGPPGAAPGGPLLSSGLGKPSSAPLRRSSAFTRAGRSWTWCGSCDRKPSRVSRGAPRRGRSRSAPTCRRRRPRSTRGSRGSRERLVRTRARLGIAIGRDGRRAGTLLGGRGRTSRVVALAKRVLGLGERRIYLRARRRVASGLANSPSVLPAADAGRLLNRPHDVASRRCGTLLPRNGAQIFERPPASPAATPFRSASARCAAMLAHAGMRMAATGSGPKALPAAAHGRARRTRPPRREWPSPSCERR